MNVFEKYLDNVNEAAELTEVINQLCILHLMKCAPQVEKLWRKKFKEFDCWKIDTDNPNQIEIHYYATDVEPNDSINIYHEVKKIPWNNLLIKIDGYE